jgi:hypothetical protein
MLNSLVNNDYVWEIMKISLVHDSVHYQMKAKLKVPRPVGIKHDKEAEEEFKKNYPKPWKPLKNTSFQPVNIVENCDIGVEMKVG